MREDAEPRELSAAEFTAVYMRGAGHPFLVLDGVPYPTIDIQCVPCGYAYLDAKLDDDGCFFDIEFVVGVVGAQISSNPSGGGVRDT
ncbi:uncharacterized protein EDB91DRAFT_317576 [Suillus paluster]|uniref:uncharacterized protein n=1 Tax=Suillus paluster TaxID=48578 RepID=UPI001B860DA9|nr:uncharacterized protein EDB91DRAFT_317576 [Suillus paluster]KAG1741857.1 hypothetical protein EDB91DRAFT_317576 [Suillus paluster]